MDIDSEMRLVREATRAFVADAVRPAAAAIDRDDKFFFELYRQMGEMGLLAMTLPEVFGGLDATTLAWAMVQEELAKGSAAVADAQMVNKLMCDAILSNGSEALKQDLLPRMGRGEIICAIAQTEADAGSDVSAIRTTARPVEGGYLLNGTKQFITFAGVCDLAIVVASSDLRLGKGGIGLFLASADSEGFIRGSKTPVMGVKGLATGELVFSDCFVADSHVLAAPGQGLKKALTSLNSGRIGMAAQSVGMAQAAFDLALTYSKERKAFGAPIANLQAIQFMLAEMSTSIEASRLMTHRAAKARDLSATPIRQAAEAKLFASEIAAKVVDQSVQIHGAYGYSTEAEVERIYRDIRVYRIWEGTSQIQKLVIARQLLSGDASPS